MLFGVGSADDPLVLNTYDVFLKELMIKTSYINQHTTQKAIDLFANSRIDTGAVFSAEMTMEEEVCELLARQGKVVVKIN